MDILEQVHRVLAMKESCSTYYEIRRWQNCWVDIGPQAVADEIERLRNQVNQLAEVYSDAIDRLIATCRPLAEAVGKPIDKHNYPCLTGAVAAEDIPDQVIPLAVAEIERLRAENEELRGDKLNLAIELSRRFQ